MKPKVYYSKNDFSKIVDKLPEIKGKTGLKVHFGEMGCTTFLDPKYSKEVYEKVKKSTDDVSLIECNVLYKGSRTHKKEHLETAQKHGFDFAPIDICDGETGDDFWTIKIDEENFKEIFVGANLEKYENIIPISHFKGHGAAGFGGTLKNVGMGLGSRKGKMAMHAAFNVIIDKNRCIGCGTCAAKCDANAIEIIDGIAKIDYEKCLHCAGCIANCPEGAAKVPWGSNSPEELQERIAEYFLGIKSKINMPFYINVLENITPACDCMDNPQKPIAPDLGYLASSDPVALDQASCDLLAKAEGKDIFKELHGVDTAHQMKYAEEIGLGSRDYELVELDN